MNSIGKTIVLVLLGLVGWQQITAKSPLEEPRWGSWLFLNITHDIGRHFFIRPYFEHCIVEGQQFECVYNRTTFGWRPLSWMHVGASYVPVRERGRWTQNMEIEAQGSLTSGALKVSLRERYRHGFTGSSYNELRTSFKVAYAVPNSWVGLYVAPEVFTWAGKWQKTRHYVGVTYACNRTVQLEGYYMYYAFKERSVEHIVGLGMNLNL